MINASINAIIFDLGGVILNIDYSLTISAFAELGFPGFSAQFTQLRQSLLFHEFEKGRIGSDEFYEGINKLSPVPMTNAAIDGAWNAMLLDLPERRIAFIERLRQTRRIFLLSNINTIHIETFTSILRNSVGIERFNTVFEHIYYSCNMGMRKPDAEIFECVMRENGLKAGDTLFIDDTLQHVAGAAGLGMKTILLAKHGEIGDVLAGL